MPPSARPQPLAQSLVAGVSLGLYTTGSGMLPPPAFLDPIFEPLLGKRRT